MRAIILPGNGCDDILSANWYSWLQERLQSEGRFSEVVCKTMPDPHRARRKIWLPFILKTLCADENTVLIGHSSGAVAAMRLCETARVAGLVLVSACHTDLGEPSETQAGYYPPSGGEWRWDAIRSNSAGNIAILHSDNDPFIPLDEPRHVASQLGVSLTVVPGRSHFFKPAEEIVQATNDVLAAAAAARDAAPARGAAPGWNAEAGVWQGDRAAAGAFEPPEPLWIFGYGSLCWRQEFPYEESFVGRVAGWGRFFAQRSTDHRGTVAAPGLVATLLKDASLDALGVREAGAPPSVTCGVCYRVAAADAQAVLAGLDFREKGGYTREIIEVVPRDADGGASAARAPVEALLYSATPDNPNFSAEMLRDTAEAARVIGAASGPSGPNRDYLLNMAAWLEAEGEHDPHIAALVQLMQTSDE